MMSGRNSVLVKEWYARGPEIDPRGVTVRAIKLNCDGALGSRGAWLLEPYSDRTDFSGMATYPMDSVLKRSREGLKYGFQICSHAIGDRANKEVLDQYEAALQENPDKMDHRFRTLGGVLLTVVLFDGSARADVLHLKTGGRLEGILVTEGPATLTLDMGSGKLSLPRSSVLRIERKESALAEYRARLASVSRGDVTAYAELARFAAEHGLRSEARVMWARVVSLDPRNVEGHLALGHVLVDGRYVDEDTARQASGMVRFEGSWMTPSEQDSILRGREQRRDDDRSIRLSSSRSQRLSC